MIYRGEKLGWCATSGTPCILYIHFVLRINYGFDFSITNNFHLWTKLRGNRANFTLQPVCRCYTIPFKRCRSCGWHSETSGRPMNGGQPHRWSGVESSTAQAFHKTLYCLMEAMHHLFLIYGGEQSNLFAFEPWGWVSKGEKVL